MKVVRIETTPDLAEIRPLLREYQAWVGGDLCFQNFEKEVAELPGDYVAPDGILLTAMVGGRVAGCVAAHRWSEGACEMKRLFVRDAFRGSGCGRALVDAVIGWARRTGYRRILLDTLPAMSDAQRLYEQFGFQEVPAYRPNPVPGVRFLELVLHEDAEGDK